MISVPRIRSIEIDNYGLFPGPDSGPPGLRARIPDGLTLIIGANGLGKTTLITLMYRMLSGPYDIPSLNAGEELGSRKLEATLVRPEIRDSFAVRVSDRARIAQAKLAVKIDRDELVIERRLANLSLVSLTLNGKPLQSSEGEYQKLICSRAGVSSFGDFLLMLRYLVFYFEDRRALVWDQTAQRQLLRMLFLPPAEARKWTELEREILERDTSIRNFQAVFNREENLLTSNLKKNQSATALRSELEMLERVQAPDLHRQAELGSRFASVEQIRQQEIVAHLTAEQEREERYRAVEEAKLLAIQSRFPNTAATGRYILAQLMADHECLVCGTHNVEAAELYTKRILEEECVVCATPLKTVSDIIEHHALADERVKARVKALADADRVLEGASMARERAEVESSKLRRELTKLEADIATRSARIEEIVDLLPPSERELRDQRDSVSTLRASLEARKEELATKRREFAKFIAARTRKLLQHAEAIVRDFEEYAKGFLSEEVALTWSTHRARVGQTGELIEFPSFYLEMSGSDFATAVRRAGPNSVSESQREFVDLAFRMALMRTASASGSSALIIDTPESSLDAIFAKRAADILLKFSKKTGNSLVVTSNLVEGSLVPTLVNGLKRYKNAKSRLINLFKIAHPTAAVDAEKTAYKKAMVKLLGVELAR